MTNDKALEPLGRHYFPLIDTLRGVAILLVLILHFHLSYRLTEGLWADLLPAIILNTLVKNGNYGVVIFFVISGFLITSRSLARYGKLERINIRSFYTFRVARIVPNILLMVFIVVSLGALGFKIFQNDKPEPSMLLTITSILTFTHNLLMQKYDYFNYCLNILWSLSVEEVFYLMFPITALTLKKPKFLLSFLALFVFIGPYYRYLHRNDETDIFALYNYLACFDAIAIGCLVALLRSYFQAPQWTKRIQWLLVSGIAIIYLSGGIWDNVVFGISAIALFTGALIFIGAENETKNKLLIQISRPLQSLGKYSYELYLFHIIVLALMKTAIPRNEVSYLSKQILFLAFIAISLAVAILISRYFSEPLNKRIRLALNPSQSSYKSSRLELQPEQA